MPAVTRHAPAIAATALCWAIVAVLLAVILGQTHGTFVYPLDDTYIHLALARTLAAHGVWGIGPQEFGSASSSPGWTLLLAALTKLFGPHVITPLIINLLLAATVLFVADAALKRFQPSITQQERFIALAVIVLFTPLPNLILVGMEGVAQTLSILLLILFGIEALTTEMNPRLIIALLASAFFAGAIRYEAVFAILPLCLLLALRRRFVIAALTGLAAAITPVAFGLYAHRHSGFWLPFSIIMKQRGAYASLHDRLLDLLHSKIVFTEALILLAALLLLRRRRNFWEPAQLLLLLTFAVTLLHSLKEPTGTLLRYDSYLITLILITLSVLVAQSPLRLADLARPIPAVLAMLSIVFAVHLTWRSVKHGALVTEQAAVDRYHDHLQMARFVARSYPRDTIALNDIGTAAFYTDATLIDLAGLGSVEPVRAAAQGRRLTRDEVAAWASSRYASIAILQPQWIYVARITPPSWTLVATWRVPRDVVFGDPLVGFYAVTPEQIPRLCRALADFPLPTDDALLWQHGVCDVAVTSVPAAHEAAAAW